MPSTRFTELPSPILYGNNAQLHDDQPYPGIYFWSIKNPEERNNFNPSKYIELPENILGTLRYFKEQYHTFTIILDRRLACLPPIVIQEDAYALQWHDLRTRGSWPVISHRSSPTFTALITQAQSVIDNSELTDIIWVGRLGDDLDHFFPFQECLETFNGEQKKSNQPSLLSLLTKLKKQNPETYYKNKEGEIHKPLALALNKLILSKKRPRSLSYCLNVFSKFLGYDVIKLNLRSTGIQIIPKKLAGAYTDTNGNLVWILKEDFEYRKTNRDIQWCSHNKGWFHCQCFQRIYLSPTVSIDVASLGGNAPVKTYTCDKCQYIWDIKQTKIQLETERQLCPNCITKSLSPNPPTKLDKPIWAYHSHKTNWNYYIQRTKNPWDQHTLPMGLEVEVRALDGCLNSRDYELGNPVLNSDYIGASGAAWTIYQCMKEINPNYNLLYFETDGSLDHQGFEIITNPMTLAFHQDFWPQMIPSMIKVCRGWQVTTNKDRSDSYGIHITCSRKYWNDRDIMRLAKFCGVKQNADFIHGIAQRSQLYSGGAELLGAADETMGIKFFGTINKKKLTSSPRCNVHVKGDLVEIRMFRSTLKQESFLKNLEFVDSFREWCRNSSWSVNHLDYIKWLTEKKEHYKKYANLLNYLSKDKFSVKGRSSVSNPVKHLVKEGKTKGQIDLIPLLPEDIKEDFFSPELEQ